MNSNKWLKYNFWISEFVVLFLSNIYCRKTSQGDIYVLLVLGIVMLISSQFCFFYIFKMLETPLKHHWILIIVLSYILAHISVVILNYVFLNKSHEVNFLVVLIDGLLLLPTLVSINGLNRQ